MPRANRNARITARFRERERELIEAAARQRGVHLSELIRNASVAEARQELLGEGYTPKRGGGGD